MASKCLVVNNGGGDNDKEFRHNVGGGLQVYDSKGATSEDIFGDD